mgnify:CR=1 FL=1
MKVGIIGISTATLDLGTRAAQAGFEVSITDPRGHALFLDLIGTLDGNIKLSILEQTADADILIVSLPWEHLQKTLHPLRKIDNKIILHTNNYLFSNEIYDVEPAKKTAVQIISALFPQAHIIKLFSIFNFSTAKESKLSKNTRILFSGGNIEVKKKVRSFLDKLGFSSTDLVEYNFNM